MASTRISKMSTLLIVGIALITRVTSLDTPSADCSGEHCHKDPPGGEQEFEEEGEHPMLYWLTGDSCYKVGDFNPFLTMEQQQEDPKFCPEGTEFYWKDPKEWTQEEKDAMGLVEVDYDEYMKQTEQKIE
ncbi:uncharacterized protein [Haliotis cracherodii]|uniref:uncharacterized protein n=1 Tax=Haliotis cracherodii TaxID=6455 RepID=UPI0039E8E4CB